MGGFKKLLSKTTDMLGLTDGDVLAEQQRQAREQQRAMENQAALEANSGTENVTDVSSGGAAATSADAITSDQKRRRAGSMSNVLGI